MAKYVYVYRSAVTGQFVSKEVAEADPKTHVKERIKVEHIYEEPEKEGDDR